MEKAGGEFEFAVKEPRFDESELVVLATGADLRSDLEFLAAALEERRFGDVEVALAEFDEADEVFHRVEAGADDEVAGALGFFGDFDDEVFAVGNVCGFNAEVDGVEVLKPFQPHLAEAGAHHVERIAGSDGQFTADDFVFCFGVAADVDLIDEVFLPFLDLVVQVHGSFRSVGGLDGKNSGIALVLRAEVAGAFVKIGHGLVVVVESLGSEDVAGTHGQAALGSGAGLSEENFFRGKDFVALDSQVADAVLLAFKDFQGENHFVRLGIVEANVPNGKVQIAVFVVKVAESFAVFEELVFLVDAGAGKPGEGPTVAGFDGFSQFPDFESLGAFKTHGLNANFWGFGDFEGDGSPPLIFVNGRHVFDGGFAVSLFFVEFFDGLRVGEQLFFVNRRADL